MIGIAKLLNNSILNWRPLPWMIKLKHNSSVKSMMTASFHRSEPVPNRFTIISASIRLKERQLNDPIMLIVVKKKNQLLKRSWFKKILPQLLLLLLLLVLLMADSRFCEHDCPLMSVARLDGYGL